MDTMAEPDSAGSSPTISSNQHPLENDLILRNILGFLNYSMDDVKSFRLVNKAWKIAASFQWNQLTTPLIICQKDYRNILHEPEYAENTSPAPLTIGQFLQMRTTKNNVKEKAHRYFVLDEWEIKNCQFTHVGGQIGNLELCQQFWNSVGQQIVILTLEYCHLPKDFFYVHNSLWKAIPSLQRLFLKNCIRQRISQPRPFFSNEEIDDPFGDRFDHRDILGLEGNTDTARMEKPKSSQLKSLRIHNPDGVIPARFIGWYFLSQSFPNLSELGISFQHFDFQYCSQWYISYLQTFELVETSGTSNRNASDERPLRCMSFDYEDRTYIRELESISPTIKIQSESLEKVCIYCTPFYENFYLQVSPMTLLPNVVELELAGNVSENLDFLRHVPALRILKWYTRSYDSEAFRSRLDIILGMHVFLEYTDKIVENTTKLDEASFRLPFLHTLEMDWGFISIRCWEKLGKWMPNMKNLKVTVGGDDHFAVIAKQWLAIERLEIVHGSGVTALGIVEAHLHHQGFKCLKSFTWKQCSCFKLTYGVYEEIAERELRKNAGSNVIVPWQRNLPNVPRVRIIICFQGLLENALTASGKDNLEKARRKFFNVERWHRKRSRK